MVRVMLNLKTTLAGDIAEALAQAAGAGALPQLPEKLPRIVVTRPDQADRGDLASPVALALSKVFKKSPLEIAQILIKHLPSRDYVGRVEAVAPGFINIWLSDGWIANQLAEVIAGALCEPQPQYAGRAANMEFISANPTGPLTFGNARTAFSADTLANVLECAGLKVTREYYFNDAGAQVKKLGESVLRRALQARGFEVEFPEELYQGEYINDVAREVAAAWQEQSKRDLVVEDLENAEVLGEFSRLAVAHLSEAIKKTIADDLKINFDVWSSELAIRGSGQIAASLERLKQRGETYEKDGVLWLKTTKYGDEKDRVLIKRDGEYAYISPDIAYHQDKFDRGYDLIFTFLGADHLGHVPKLRAAMRALGCDVSKLHFVVAQWLRLLRGGEMVKPSKRRGNIITPKDLIDEIGYDAARFLMTQHALTTHMDLDLDLAKERSERNPVYYVQYAYVRLQSILKKAAEEKIASDAAAAVKLSDSFELALVKEMLRLPEVVADIAESFEVQALPYYALELARATHAFYKNVPVLTAEDELKASRLQLVAAASKVLAQVLELLGISKPEKM